MENNEKKYLVFISSTYTDLKEERAKVVEAVMEMGHIPYGMEIFPATNDTQWKWIKEHIEKSDYYILIVGGRYGSVDKVTGKSYTQMEYEYARKKKIPNIAFFISDSVKLAKNKQYYVKELKEFKELVKKKLGKPYKNAEDLKSNVLQSLPQLIKNNPRYGWIKTDSIKYVSKDDKSVVFANIVERNNSERHKPFEELRKNIVAGDTFRVLGTAVSSFIEKDKIINYLKNGINIEILMINYVLLKTNRTCQEGKNTKDRTKCDIEECRFIIQQDHFSNYYNRAGDNYYEQVKHSYDTIKKIIEESKNNSWVGTLTVKSFKSFYPFSMATVIKGGDKNRDKGERMVVEFVLPFTERRLLLQCSPGKDKNENTNLYNTFYKFYEDTWENHSKLEHSNNLADEFIDELIFLRNETDDKSLKDKIKELVKLCYNIRSKKNRNDNNIYFNKYYNLIDKIVDINDMTAKIRYINILNKIISKFKLEVKI